jgi:hypothetical protein
VESVKEAGPLPRVDAGSIVFYGQTDSIAQSPDGDLNDPAVPGVAASVVYQDRRQPIDPLGGGIDPRLAFAQLANREGNTSTCRDRVKAVGTRSCDRTDIDGFIAWRWWF